MNKRELLQTINKAVKDGATQLYLAQEGITELPPEIGKLHNLTELDLSHNHLAALAPEIGTLRNLTELNLGTNQLTTVPPEIGNLHNLTRLNLNGNRLMGLPPAIGSLHNLTELNLAGSQLTALPREIGRLTNLGWLDLTGNQLSTLPPEIGDLYKLAVLILGGNWVTALPREIGNLHNLSELHLARNQLTALPPEIGNLHNLTKLDLFDNQVTLVPPEIGNLTNLTKLELMSNKLTTLPPEIGGLTNLTVLTLMGNKLTNLPPEIGRLEKLKRLHLRGNPLTDPPPEVVEQGTEAVLAYLRGRLEETRREWVSKMLVVGEGGVGKTCLLRSLRGEPYEPHCETTHGIDVQPLELAHPCEQDITMTLNCWDFGGQQIYHATHQFFLTNRSLFLVAWNARLGFEQGKLNYWLDTIEALALDSPVLLVATHVDERDADLPFENLKRKYPSIAGRCEISSKEHTGIKELHDAIARVAGDLPLMGEKWPAAWLEAAMDIRTLPDKRISAHKFEQSMAAHHVPGIAQSVLARWLHELGDILYFADDEELKDTVLLSPEWVTENISRVLECEDIIEGLGIFRQEHMADVWSDLDQTTRDRFLRLMERFDLSYRIPDDPENKSLVVERLSLDPPPDYEKRWDAILETEGCKEISMKFDLQITRPAGIPTWFIARSHRFTTNTHWRYGALFTDPPDARHLALAVAPPSERYMTLTVRGPSPQSFFALLKDGLELTLARFPGLNLKRGMPCPGHDGNSCTHEFDHAHLLKAVEREPPVMDIQCPVGFQNVSVSGLLFGIHWSTENAVLDRIGELERGDIERHAETMAELYSLS